MTTEWRNSEAQVISPKTWTRLNGTTTEVLLPNADSQTLIRVRTAPAAAPAEATGVYVTELPADAFPEPGLYAIEPRADGMVTVRRADPQT